MLRAALKKAHKLHDGFLRLSQNNGVRFQTAFFSLERLTKKPTAAERELAYICCGLILRSNA